MPEQQPHQPHTVFVSHAHADNELCDRYVAALRARGLDVWYDRTNMQAGHSLSADIEAELRKRTALVLLATPASLTSQWVRAEVAAFRYLVSQDSTRLFLPVRTAECDMPLLMRDILWLDAVSDGFDAAVKAIASALGAVPTSAKTVDQVQPKPPDTAPVATPPQSAHTMAPVSRSLVKWFAAAAKAAGTPRDHTPTSQPPTSQPPAPTPSDRLDGLIKQGDALRNLKRYHEALDAYDRVLGRDPMKQQAWVGKAAVLHILGRPAEAKEAERKARELGWKKEAERKARELGWK